MKINWKKLIIIIIITFAIGSLFAPFTINTEFYKTLDKPINVPSVVFPVVWSILYLLMSISYYIISESSDMNKKEAQTIYWVQLIVNSLWTLIFFGFKQYLVAFIWLILLVVLVIIMILRFIRINKIAGYLQIPYLLWLLFAGFLNLGIVLLN